MRDKIYIVTLYIIFALFATCLNIFVQYLVFYMLESSYTFLFAICFGTLFGLIVKYILDKKFIFTYKSNNIKQEAKNFFLYSFIGGIITIFYIVLETLFYYLYPKDHGQYIGACIGLTIGYIVKYNIDRKFIFKKEEYNER